MLYMANQHTVYISLVFMSYFGFNVAFNTLCRLYHEVVFKGRGKEYILIGQDSAS